MAPAIPDRWKDYKPVGKKIKGTRFIAFKVPLREDISNTVDSDIRLDGNILLKSVPNLGLIIDLTNTKRYYDPNFFKKLGVEYEKLMIPGRETPPKYLVDQFFNLVKEFIDNNPDNDKLIGVHCTHGVNRTGFLICNYMISKMNIDPNEAISKFSIARGHQIERTNYINALHKLMASNGSETYIERSRKISNWRDRERGDRKVPAKFNNWRDRDDVPAKSSHWRNRDEAQSRDSFERRSRSNDMHRSRNSSRSIEIHRRYSYDRKTRSEDNHHSRTRSRSPLARRRETYDSRRTSRPDRNSYSRQPTQCWPNTGNYNKFYYYNNNRINENLNNSYQHLPEATGENVINRSRVPYQPTLRTDYYTNKKPVSGRQRSINLQSYKRNRNAHNT